MREDKQKKKSDKQRDVVANPGQPLTGNKNQGDDLEEIIPREPISVEQDRPTRDDGDNDDEGALGSGQK